MQVLAFRLLLDPADFAVSTGFYEEGLGLARFREWGDPPHRGVVYFLGGGYLELHESGGGVRADGVRLWMQVADAGAAYEELLTRGIEVDQPPARKPWGLIEMELRDPDGVAIVVVETPLDHPLRRRQ